jgi:hypothetical protein
LPSALPSGYKLKTLTLKTVKTAPLFRDVGFRWFGFVRFARSLAGKWAAIGGLRKLLLICRRRVKLTQNARC